jgi:carbamoyl-phosphate synthase large subunit
MRDAVAVSNEAPVLLDHFLEQAIEVDVDAICDGHDVYISGIMEHIEQAGIHSGDSACALPPHTLAPAMQQEIERQVALMARALGVVGLMNAQLAIQNGDIYVLEVNPRASRTVPFVSKVIGVPIARVAALCMVGKSLARQGIGTPPKPGYFSVKEAVLPFAKFPGVDTLLGPEMKSTGEVMGVGASFGEAFRKAQQGASMGLPERGTAFVSVRDGDKRDCVQLAGRLRGLGFRIIATKGTAKALALGGIECEAVNKVAEGQPHVLDYMKNGVVDLIINTTEGKIAISDSLELRRAAVYHRIPYSTTMAGATAAVMAIAERSAEQVRSLQSLHKDSLS